MDRLAHTLSKMFLVLVLLFGAPPVTTLRERWRRPVVALVVPLRRRGAGNDGATLWPEPWPPEPPAPSAERVYIPVRAA